MRKLCKGMLLLLGVAVVALLMGGRTTEAAGNATMLPDTSIQVNYVNEEMIVEAGNNTVIYYSDNANAVLWESAEVVDGEAVFDISWVKPGVTTRIYLRGDVDTLVTARYLEAQEKLSADFAGDISAADVVDVERWKDVYKQYPNFSAETGYILFYTKQEGAETAFFDVDQIEWKKETTGNWRPFSELNLAQMNAKGVILYFRIKAVNDDFENDIIGVRYSSEAKVVLQKIAAAPSVNVNNAAMSLGIRNGMEYSLNKEDWYLVPVYSKGATSDKINVKVEEETFDVLPTTNRRVTSLALPLVLGVGANTKIDASLIQATPGKYQYETNEDGEITGIYVYVRTAASARKAASKVDEVLVPFGSGDPNVAQDITVTYQNTKSGTGGVMLTNKTTGETGVIYQYAIVDDPDTLTPEDLSGLKWATLKAGKTLKVSSSKALPGQYLIFRKAPQTKAELPSGYEKYPYQIQYDKVTYAGISNTSLYPGGVISAVTSNNAIAGEITYTWQRCQTATGTFETIISGKGYAASKYTIKDSDVGYYIRVEISNTSITGETASVISRNSGKIAKDPTATATPTPSPAPTTP